MTIKAMKLVLEDFMKNQKSHDEQMALFQSQLSNLENQLSEERKLRKSAERKAKSLQEKLDFANQKRFGDRHQRINSSSERTIRKLTTQRNNSLHYGSDAGAEMAATYHSVIETVKLHGCSVWNFIGTFFKNIFNGCKDYVNMVPGKITLATSQC